MRCCTVYPNPEKVSKRTISTYLDRNYADGLADKTSRRAEKHHRRRRRRYEERNVSELNRHVHTLTLGNRSERAAPPQFIPGDRPNQRKDRRTGGQRNDTRKWWATSLRNNKKHSRGDFPANNRPVVRSLDPTDRPTNKSSSFSFSLALSHFTAEVIELQYGQEFDEIFRTHSTKQLLQNWRTAALARVQTHADLDIRPSDLK